MSSEKSWTSRFFIGIWSVLNFGRRLFFNLIFIFLAIVIVAGLMAEDNQVTIADSSALILDLDGDLVIQKETVDPFDELMYEATDQPRTTPEILLKDVVFAIDNAAGDNRIKVMVLSLGGLRSAGLDKLREINLAIDRFKATGKPVYAVGDYFSQNQYYLASHADHIYLNPMGMVFLEGFGRYRMYYKSALEKLKANAHIFRVGTFKSAIEPYVRDNMSDAAKEANQAWLSALWTQYKNDVAAARGFSANNFDENIQAFSEKFTDSNDDFAQYALNNNWVDALKTRDAIRSEMINLVGKNSTRLGFNHIDFEDYVASTQPPFDLDSKGSGNIGVVVAKGAIYGGNQKPGTIGGDSTARLLRDARLDSSIDAVVLYVDSPGGSAFASEVIRQEIVNLQEAGKPVVAAMSSMAASGGYWISASADQIWASPSTITGSIGIFGMFLTYEKSLSYLGVHTDGIGTTDFTGIGVTRGLRKEVGDIFQRNIERGYDRFITLVAEERDMSKEQVDKIAQGRVWIGEQALELGLVDNLGGLSDAIAAAAKLSDTEDFGIKYVEPTLSPRELFWKELLGDVAAPLLSQAGFKLPESPVLEQLTVALNELNAFSEMNDPQGMYAYCLLCDY